MNLFEYWCKTFFKALIFSMSFANLYHMEPFPWNGTFSTHRLCYITKFPIANNMSYKSLHKMNGLCVMQSSASSSSHQITWPVVLNVLPVGALKWYQRFANQQVKKGIHWMVLRNRFTLCRQSNLCYCGE